MVWSYDRAIGHFFWRVAPKFGIRVGDRAGYFDGRYWRLRWKRRNYKASRVAWLMVTGDWPKAQIDHINRNRLDDSFMNLREATNSENCCNRNVRIDNAVGISGIYVRNGRFVVSITKDGKKIFTRRFLTLDDAAKARVAAVQEHHGQFGRG